MPTQTILQFLVWHLLCSLTSRSLCHFAAKYFVANLFACYRRNFLFESRSRNWYFSHLVKIIKNEILFKMQCTLRNAIATAIKVRLSKKKSWKSDCERGIFTGLVELFLWLCNSSELTYSKGSWTLTVQSYR